jgi:transcription elongation factor Elf1
MTKKKAVVATSRKDFEIDTCVSCPTCSREILVSDELQLPREFSVPCPNCGRRSVYQVAEVHDLKQKTETTQISERVQFGTMRATDCDLTAGKWMQPKSRLNELASWLLQ